MSEKNLQQEFISWKQKNKLFGRQTFSKFMTLKFLEAMQGVSSDEFIFKCGNLLWHYIKTPRATVDLDCKINPKVTPKIKSRSQDF